MTHAVTCQSLSVSYGDHRALFDLTLTVGAGRAVALLGPSGSGKTTLLAAIAGFLPIDAGSIAVDGHVVSEPGRVTPPEQRPVSMVFQNYALWPHLTARDIVAYPLRRAGVATPEARRRANDLLAMVGMSDLAHRYPSQLSGGQQQRVGLARAIAAEPSTYLLDEPTAHLDSTLRTVVQEEFSDRRRDLGAAAVYATHDPVEALAVADRVALVRSGRVVQVGTPAEVYESPIDEWAARLTGTAGVLTVPSDTAASSIVIGGVSSAAELDGAPVADARAAIVRPEWAVLGGDLPGVVRKVRYTGARTVVQLDTPSGELWIEVPGRPAVVPGERTGWTLARAWLV